MANFSLPHFPELNPKNLDEYYDTEIDFNGHEIQIDLNFEHKNIHTDRLDIVKEFIENLKSYDTKNKKHIEQDYANEGCDTVRTYVEHCIENFDQEELADFIDFDNKTVTNEIQLMNSLRLVRIGFYPDSEENFATFDYSINPEIADHLVVIFINATGEMNYMTIES